MQIKVNSDQWSQYLKAKAQRSALEKQIKSLEADFKIPDASQLASEFSAVQGETLPIEIVNGNGQTIGKLTVFWFPGSETPPAWRKRIS